VRLCVRVFVCDGWRGLGITGLLYVFKFDLNDKNSAVADMLPDACTNVFTRGRHATVSITYSYVYQNLTPSMMGVTLSYDALNDGSHIEL